MASGHKAEKGVGVMKSRGTAAQQPSKVKMARERYEELRQILEDLGLADEIQIEKG